MGVENYNVIGLVGEGSFGKVYKGRHKFTGQGELFEILEDDKHLPEEQVQAIAKQLDPIKYPDNMSSSFKVPQNRLTWPALLEHPFVKETTEEVEARETRSSTAAERGCVAAWRGERYKIQTSGGLAVSSPEDNSGISFQDDAQSNIPDSKAVNSSPNEEFPGFANEVKQSGIRSFHNKEKSAYFV